MSASKLIFGTLNALILVSGPLQSFRERNTLNPSSQTIMFSSSTMASKIFQSGKSIRFFVLLAKLFLGFQKNAAGFLNRFVQMLSSVNDR